MGSNHGHILWANKTVSWSLENELKYVLKTEESISFELVSTQVWAIVCIEAYFFNAFDFFGFRLSNSGFLNVAQMVF
jgi:hypothetical protein